jgi:hypothetical protein
MDMMSMMKNDQPNLKMTMPSVNNNSHNMVNVSDYQSAQGLINKAHEIFNNIKAKMPFDKASVMCSLENGLGQLKSVIDAKKHTQM